MVDSVSILFPESSDERDTVYNDLAPLIWDATKLYSFFSDAEWETRDRDLIMRDGAKGFQKLQQRYERPSQ